jgi:hypothetical protein
LFIFTFCKVTVTKEFADKDPEEEEEAEEEEPEEEEEKEPDSYYDFNREKWKTYDKAKHTKAESWTYVGDYNWNEEVRNNKQPWLLIVMSTNFPFYKIKYFFLD